MSKRVDELEQQVRDLQAALTEAAREIVEVSGANGMVCAKLDEAEKALARTHESRDEAWKRVTALEQQIAARDITIRGLTVERDTAVAAVEAMRIEDMEAGMAS
jgi:uncharacterized membrane protein (DUF2068 family)